MNSPYRVATDTYAFPSHLQAGPFGYLSVNCYLVQGTEPVLVDTGMPIDREEFLRNLWSLVDPGDLRWIILTHDDNDHAGNLREVMEAAPQAKVVTNFLSVARMQDHWSPPPERTVLVNPGQRFSAGDREMVTLRPPFYDSPSTFALYDTKTGTLFSSDSFGGFIPRPVEDVAELSQAEYAESALLFGTVLSPWTAMVRQERFDAMLEEVRALKPETVLSAHGPVMRGRPDWLLRNLSRLPSMEPFVGPDQAAMEAMMVNLEAGRQLV